MGMFSLVGTPVCLVAFEELLLCVSCVSGSKSPEPILQYGLYNVFVKQCLSKGRLPLSSKASLRWTGFSSDAMPLALDSSGHLRALLIGITGAAGGEWVPVASLDGEKALWPVRADGGAVWCEVLEKVGKEPRVLPGVRRLHQLKFQLPGHSEASERVLRHRMLQVQQEFAVDNELFAVPKKLKDDMSRRSRLAAQFVQKFFEKTTKAGDVELALDIAKRYFPLLDSPQQFLEDAIKFASNANKKDLVEKLEELQQGKKRVATASGAVYPAAVRPRTEGLVGT